jgi:hypothetical protein
MLRPNFPTGFAGTWAVPFRLPWMMNVLPIALDDKRAGGEVV